MNGNVNFGDKDMLGDALSSQKFITENYNSFANESATLSIKSEFINILNEEHQIHQEIFEEMKKRGWYQVEPADLTKINQTKQKFYAG